MYWNNQHVKIAALNLFVKDVFSMFFVILTAISGNVFFIGTLLFYLRNLGKTNALKCHISQINREKHGFTVNMLPTFYLRRSVISSTQFLCINQCSIK